MHKPFRITFENIIERIIVSAVFMGSVILPFSVISAATDNLTGVYSEDETKLTTIQKQAREHRYQGVEYQRLGNFDMAMAYYQKAVELDPAYAVAYNDLGIIYEAKGMSDRAEESYLKAVKIDPNYLSSYSNLALFYEGKRDLKQAAVYWQKRIEFGPVGDPWTEKARKRLEDIRLVLGDKTSPDEDNVINLMNDVLVQKSTLKTDDKALARKHMEKARLSYKKGDELTAFKEAGDAKALDPSNREIDEFLDKVQIRMLSR
jgi:tetratricopeptide (TPR) repeat protein